MTEAQDFKQRSAELLLAETGYAVALCPVYGENASARPVAS